MATRTKVCDNTACGITISKDGSVGKKAYRYGDANRVNTGRGYINNLALNFRLYVCSAPCYYQAKADLAQPAKQIRTGRFADFVEEWKTDIAPYRVKDDRRVTPQEEKRRCTTADYWVEVLGNPTFEKLSSRTVTNHLREMRKSNRAASTIMHYRESLALILSAAVQPDYKLMTYEKYTEWFGIDKRFKGSIPVFHDEGEKDPYKKHYTKEERETLKRLPDNTWTRRQARVAALLTVNTGMRISEACALRWHQILDDDREPNLDNPQWATLTNSINRQREFAPLKNGRPRTTKILNSKEMRSLLKEHKTFQNEHRLQNPSDHWDHDLIICDEDGSPYQARSIGNTFRREVRKLDLVWERLGGAENGKRLKKMSCGTFHDLRSTFVTVCLSDLKIPQQLVMEWVGHATNRMNDHYFDSTSNLLHSDVREKMDNFDQFAV